MLDSLQPKGLTDVAKELGVDPFEVVRLLVASGSVPESLTFTDDQVAAVRAYGGIQHWWADTSPPADANPKRGRVRGAIKALLDSGAIGDTTTRLDNMWRGLGPEDQLLLEQAVSLLMQDGHVRTFAAVQGAQIAVAPGAVDTLRAFADGGAEPPSLAVLW